MKFKLVEDLDLEEDVCEDFEIVEGLILPADWNDDPDDDDYWEKFNEKL